MLASNGAYHFSTTRGITGVPQESLIASNALANWQKWKSRLENPIHPISITNSENLETEVLDDVLMQDTVGAIALLEGEGMAAGVSRRVNVFLSA